MASITMVRDLKRRPRRLGEAMTERVPPKSNTNIRHSHFAPGMRYVNHAFWKPWEEDVARWSKHVEKSRFLRANRFYYAVERMRGLSGNSGGV
jgi:hypothetical protein